MRPLLVAGGFCWLFAAVAIKLITVMIIAPAKQHKLLPSDQSGGPGLPAIGIPGVELLLLFVNFFLADRLYALRCRRLAIYGAVEIAVGLLSALLATNQAYGVAASRPVILFLTEVAAIYVSVRGLDNIHKALPSGNFKRYWEAHFFGAQ